MNKIRFPRAHVVYWVISTLITFFGYKFPHYNPDAPVKYLLIYWSGVILDYGLIMIEFYLYYLIIVPKTLLKTFQPFKYILLSLVIMVVGLVLRSSFWHLHVIVEGVFPFKETEEQVFNLIQNATFPPTMSIIISIIEIWVLSEIEKSKLENLTNDSKINFLKSQINPHFIFNTLNNIYSLSLKSKERTSTALSKLQSTFTYLKKVENSSTVTIKDTNEYISSYVELSKMRLKYPEKVRFTFEYSDLERRIYPMLLMPFIENAFKHSNLVEVHDFISIQLICLKNDVEIIVKNSMPSHVMNKDRHSGIGLVNVKERLRLLFEKEQYHISTEVINDEFISRLKMPYAKL